LKLAATHLAYDRLQYDPKTDEKKINDMKNAFITNLFLFKIGKKLELRNYMRTKDPDIKSWSPPFSSNSQTIETLSCTGKNIADGVESLLGALFLSSNLYTTLKFISDIQLVPV
jgi:dsRNA-specific ribonuclease